MVLIDFGWFDPPLYLPNQYQSRNDLRIIFDLPRIERILIDPFQPRVGLGISVFLTCRDRIDICWLSGWQPVDLNKNRFWLMPRDVEHLRRSRIDGNAQVPRSC